MLSGPKAVEIVCCVWLGCDSSVSQRVGPLRVTCQVCLCRIVFRFLYHPFGVCRICFAPHLLFFLVSLSRALAVLLVSPDYHLCVSLVFPLCFSVFNFIGFYPTFFSYFLPFLLSFFFFPLLFGFILLLYFSGFLCCEHRLLT